MWNAHLTRKSVAWPIAFLAGAAFVADCLAPPTVAAGLWYLLPLSLTYQRANPRTVFSLATGFTALIILKLLFYPSSTFIISAVANAMLSVACIWGLAIFLAKIHGGKASRTPFSTLDTSAPKPPPNSVVDQSIRERYALLQSVVENIDEVIFVKDLRGRYLLINRAGARFVGKEVAEILGKDDTEIFSPETALPIVENDRKILATEQAETLELVGAAAGVKRVYLTTKSPCRDQRGRIIGISGIARDITESKRLEEERNQLTARIRLQIERLPLAYVWLDKEHRVLEWNPAAEKIFGYSKAEILGQVALEKIVPLPLSEHLEGILVRLQRGEMEANNINENRTKDGRIITCEWFNTPLVESDGSVTGVISLAQDISERKEAERQLNAYSKNLKALSQQLIGIQEGERRRLARELHDELGQSLSVARLKVLKARRLADRRVAKTARRMSSDHRDHDLSGAQSFTKPAALRAR